MMTKKILILTGVIGVAVAFTACGDDRSPGHIYMPDMTYSRAYETYAPTGERLANSEVEGSNPFFNGRPVAGTIARGDMAAYQLKNDSAGYEQAAAIKNPLDLAGINLKESERLYLVNCGICHGAKLDGNGPLYNNGAGPFTAAPKNLMGDDMKVLPEGKMFHVVTYGKGQMGSYASQLTTKQRWMVIAFVKAKQHGGVGAAATDSTGTATAPGAAPLTGSQAGTAAPASGTGAQTGTATDSASTPK